MFIKRWFDTVGPYKGSLRKTSNFPHKKDAVENLVRLCDYLELISVIPDHSKLVFADEKPMKECMIFLLVRGDPLTGDRLTNKSRANSKNRYNILAAVNSKVGVIPPVQSVVIEETTNALIFYNLLNY